MNFLDDLPGSVAEGANAINSEMIVFGLCPVIWGSRHSGQLSLMLGSVARLCL